MCLKNKQTKLNKIRKDAQFANRHKRKEKYIPPTEKNFLRYLHMNDISKRNYERQESKLRLVQLVR